MNNKKDLPARKPNRLTEFDYSKNGAYFITICTKDRKCILSNLVGEGLRALPKIELTTIGKEIVDSIKYINENYENIFIDNYVVMPNHIHLIVVIDNKTGGHGDPPLQKIIGQIKSYTTNKYGMILWQRSYYDHIIRDEEDYINICEYINNNALKWQDDKYFNGGNYNG